MLRQNLDYWQLAYKYILQIPSNDITYSEVGLDEVKFITPPLTKIPSRPPSLKLLELATETFSHQRVLP